MLRLHVGMQSWLKQLWHVYRPANVLADKLLSARYSTTCRTSLQATFCTIWTACNAPLLDVSELETSVLQAAPVSQVEQCTSLRHLRKQCHALLQPPLVTASFHSAPAACRQLRSSVNAAGTPYERASQATLQRSFSAHRSIAPRFKGGKIKLRTAYKERFKLMNNGSIKVFPPGYRHRRSRKGNAQRRRLKQPKLMHQTYASTLRRMGFK